MAASSYPAHHAAGERLEGRRHRPAQATLARHGGADPAPRHIRRDPAARDFDLGQFRHGVPDGPAELDETERRSCGQKSRVAARRWLVRRTEYTYTGRPMFSRRNYLPFALIPALVAAGACAQIDAPGEAPAVARSANPTTRVASVPAESSLSEAMLYEFLLGEIAAQRGDPGLAAQTYIELARRTRDPRVARRAVELASAARQQAIALEAARLWHETDPDSTRALQTVTALVVATGKVDDAEPYLAKLLAANGTDTASGFMQLNRLLARAPQRIRDLTHRSTPRVVCPRRPCPDSVPPLGLRTPGRARRPRGDDPRPGLTAHIE